MTNADAFVPLANNTTFQNLRETMEVLADVQSSRKYRRIYYENSPLPGAMWEDHSQYGPVLVNADQIIPRGYTDIDLTDQ